MESARFSPQISHINDRHHRMSIEENRKINGTLSILPLVFGCLGFLLCGTYEAQRDGCFPPQTGLQPHVDNFLKKMA
jgi:hypothetical protein